MSSVTTRIKNVKQPFGGYLPPKMFSKDCRNDGAILSDKENIHPSIVGLAVDYLTRYAMNSNAKQSFRVSLLGSNLVGELDVAMKMLEEIKCGNKEKAIISACRLAGYDVCVRAGVKNYVPIQTINPDKETINNIHVMVNRGVNFLISKGIMVADGFTFEGGYTETVDSGDGDYIVADILLDLKVSKNGLDNKQTLQLLMYYLMGKHSINPVFDSVNKIGVYNPRLNIEYQLSINDISPDIIKAVEKDVIGYAN